MEYLNSNLDIVKKKKPSWYKKLSDILLKLESDKSKFGKFKVVEAKDGEKTVEIYDDKSVARLNSVYSPKKEMLRWIDKFKKYDKITSFVMFGMGTGLFYRSIKNIVDRNAFIFFYEPDVSLFLFCMKNFDMSELLSDDRVLVYINGINDADFFKDLLERINWAMLSTQVVCFHPIYDKIYKNQYIKYIYGMEQFKELIIAKKNTSLVYAKKFTVNTIKNFIHIKKSNYISELIGKIEEDIPVIIVSAGPSLDKNIDELKRAEKKSLILATDTSVKCLLEHDIKFDAIVTVDGRKSIKHLMDERCANYPLFTIPDARNEILEANHGRKIWLNGAGYLENIYLKYNYKFPKYNSGGSVATAAFWIARNLKVKTIILIGQDLAYLGENSHAGGVKKQHIEWTEKEEIFVEGINGGKIRTRMDWVTYLKWFENEISLLQGKVEVIDATEGGAKIAGAYIMTLSNAIEKYCEKDFNFEELLDSIPFTFNEDKYKNIYDDICYMKNEFIYIRKNSEYGETAAKRIISLIKKNDVLTEKIDSYSKQINDAQEVIQKQKVYVLLDEYVSADLAERLEMTSKKYDSEIEKNLEQAKSMMIMFKALITAVDELVPILDETLKKM